MQFLLKFQLFFLSPFGSGGWPGAARLTLILKFLEEILRHPEGFLVGFPTEMDQENQQSAFSAGNSGFFQFSQELDVILGIFEFEKLLV